MHLRPARDRVEQDVVRLAERHQTRDEGPSSLVEVLGVAPTLRRDLLHPRECVLHAVAQFTVDDLPLFLHAPALGQVGDGDHGARHAPVLTERHVGAHHRHRQAVLVVVVPHVVEVAAF